MIRSIALVAALVLWQLLPSEASAQIPTQNQCTSTYDPARSYCVPVEITDWRWYINHG